jgi:hypothetical protein
MKEDAKKHYDKRVAFIDQCMAVSTDIQPPATEHDVEGAWRYFYASFVNHKELYAVAGRRIWNKRIYVAFKRKFKHCPYIELCYTVWCDDAATNQPMPK